MSEPQPEQVKARRRPIPRVTYRGTGRGKGLMVIGLTIITLTLLGASLHSSGIFVPVLSGTCFVVMLVITLREPGSGHVLVFDDHVAVVGMVRTYRWCWEDIEGFTAQNRLFFGTTATLRVLGVKPHGKRTRWLRTACGSPRPDGTSWVDDAVAALNERLKTITQQ